MRLVDEAAAGQPFVICKSGRPMVRITRAALWPAADHRPEAPSRSAPSGERPVLDQEGDQAPELSGVLWGGVELVLELHKSASSLESSSSSCFILCSCAILRFSNSISLSS